jgi:hypothetical protein
VAKAGDFDLLVPTLPGEVERVVDWLASLPSFLWESCYTSQTDRFLVQWREKKKCGSQQGPVVIRSTVGIRNVGGLMKFDAAGRTVLLPAFKLAFAQICELGVVALG